MKNIAVWIGMPLLLFAVTASAEIYRWVDADGKVHYTDRPVQGSREVHVKVPGGTAPEPSPASQAAEQDTGQDKPDATAAPKPPADADTAEQVQAQLCKDAQQRLSSYENADSIYEDGPDGRRTLSLEERVNTILKARQAVKDSCVPPPS